MFRSGDDVMEVKKLSIPADSGKVDITVHDFGGSVKAVLVILGLTGRDPQPEGERWYYRTWPYKYAYWVTPHWTSGSMADGVLWVDSVNVAGDITVGDGATLTVASGTYVSIAEGCSLNVAGTMRVEGGPADPVEFESASTSPEPGDWPGLYCSGTVEMACCELRYADTGITVADEGIVVTLDGCTVGGFTEYGADVTGPYTRFEATGTRFEAGRAVGGVRGDSASSITLDGCTVEGEAQYCVYISGDEDTLNVSGSTLETTRQNGIVVRLLGGPHAIITGSSITGEADSLTYGIKSDATLGGSAWVVLDDVDISDVKHGVYASQTELHAGGCRISDFSSAGVHFVGSGTNSCTLERCRLDAAAVGATGIHVDDASYTTLCRDTVQCGGSGDKSGIELLGMGQGNLGPADVESCSVSGFQNDLYASYMDLNLSYSILSGFTNDGIKAAGSEIAMSHNTVIMGSIGVRGIELASGTTGTFDHNNITCTDGSGLRYGILSSTDGTVDLEYNWL